MKPIVSFPFFKREVIAVAISSCEESYGYVFENFTAARTLANSFRPALQAILRVCHVTWGRDQNNRVDTCVGKPFYTIFAKCVIVEVVETMRVP
jgi:hypothetical protein